MKLAFVKVILNYVSSQSIVYIPSGDEYMWIAGCVSFAGVAHVMLLTGVCR
jgi:hypothetical protein